MISQGTVRQRILTPEGFYPMCINLFNKMTQNGDMCFYLRSKNGWNEKVNDFGAIRIIYVSVVLVVLGRYDLQ